MRAGRAGDFDGFMRSTQAARKEKLGDKKRRSISVPPAIGSGGGLVPHHVQKLLAPQDPPKWSSVSANECGRMFGERNSATLGANLFRQEREADMKRKMRHVDAILRAFDENESLGPLPMLSASTSMLPALNATSSNLRQGAGYVKVDLAAPAAGISVFNGEILPPCLLPSFRASPSPSLSSLRVTPIWRLIRYILREHGEQCS